MPRALYTNNALTQLSSDAPAASTTLEVLDGSKFPSPTGGDYAWVTLDNGTANEIVLMTARSGNTLTVTRGQQGTASLNFASGSTVAVRWTRDGIDELYTQIDTKFDASDVSAYGATLIDDADAATARTTLGLGSLATLSTINNANWSGTDLAVANGGTGASDAATARTNLGLGTLATLSTVSNANWSGTDLALVNGGTGASDAATARTNLGLGSLATLGTINDSNWSGTDLAVTNGGTGASDAATARTNLGLGALATLGTINDANWSGTDLAVANGGTGASDAATARTNLGLANLATTTASAFALTILDDADASAVRTTIGAAATSHTHAATDITSGVLSTARLGTGTADSSKYLRGDGTWQDLPGGGDMLKSENLSGLANYTTARTNLGLGTLATLSTISDSNWSGTDLAVTNGGTGASDAATARTNLGLGTAAVANTGTSGATIPLLNGSNTWGAFNQFTGLGAYTSSSTPVGNVKLGRMTTQYVDFHGDAAGHYITGVSPAGAAEKNVLYLAVSIDAGATLARRWSFDASTGAIRDVTGGFTFWNQGNDGAGSGLDADTLDGVQGSSYATLTGAQTLTNKTLTAPIISTISNTGTLTLPTSTDTLVGRATTDTLTNKTLTSPAINGAALSGTFSGNHTKSGAITFTASNPHIFNTAAATQRLAIYQSGGVTRWAVGTDNSAESGSEVGSNFVFYSYTDAGAFLSTVFSLSRSTGTANFVAQVRAGNGTAGSPAFSFTSDSDTGMYRVGADWLGFSTGGTLRLDISTTQITSTLPTVMPVAAGTETTGVLTSASAWRTIQLTGNITINNSVFAAGNIIVVYAGASARTITQGTGVTMRLDGTSTTGTRTLAARGMATLFFVSASEVIVAGKGVT